MAPSVWGGWCLWKERWHWSHTDEEMFPCISLWTLCHILSTLLQNSSWNIQSLIFIETSLQCVCHTLFIARKWPSHPFSSPLTTREAALESPHFPPYLCALEAIAVSDRYQDACFFLLCNKEYRQREPSAEYPANAAWNSIMGICGGSFCLFDEFLWWWYVR